MKIDVKTCWYILLKTNGIFNLGSFFNNCSMACSFPVKIAVPSISYFTTLGLVLMLRPKSTVTLPLLLSFSSRWALRSKRTDSASLMPSSLVPVKVLIFTVTVASDKLTEDSISGGPPFVSDLI